MPDIFSSFASLAAIILAVATTIVNAVVSYKIMEGREKRALFALTCVMQIFLFFSLVKTSFDSHVFNQATRTALDQLAAEAGTLHADIAKTLGEVNAAQLAIKDVNGTLANVEGDSRDVVLRLGRDSDTLLRLGQKTEAFSSALSGAVNQINSLMMRSIATVTRNARANSSANAAKIDELRQDAERMNQNVESINQINMMSSFHHRDNDSSFGQDFGHQSLTIQHSDDSIGLPTYRYRSPYTFGYHGFHFD